MLSSSIRKWLTSIRQSIKASIVETASISSPLTYHDVKVFEIRLGRRIGANGF